MEQIIFDLLKPFAIAIVSYILFIKIRPINFIFWEKAFLCTGFIFLASTSFILLRSIIVEPYKTAIVIFVISIFLTVFLKERIESILICVVIVYAVSYMLYSVSTIFLYFVFLPIPIEVSPVSITNFTLTGAVSIVLALIISKIKVDISPIHKKYASGIFLSISSIIIILYGLYRVEVSDEFSALVFAGYLMLGYGLYSWFRRENTISKNENANDVINNKYQSILEQKEKDNAVLRDMQDYLSSVVHKEGKKLDAMRRAVEKVVMRSEQTDVLIDAKKILNEIRNSRNKAANDYNQKVLNSIILPLTGMQIVDAKFEMVSEKAVLKSIDFDLEINGDVSDFEHVIPQFDLVNIIGDLTENSFTAIKYLDKIQPFHKIHFTIGNTNNIYELCISDSGIPFNIETLFKLGVERVTSHPDDGGSGYGYETIFELLNECGASLIITEYEPVPYVFSKTVVIRFDGKMDYILKSFRANKIKNQNTNINLTIKNLTDGY